MTMSPRAILGRSAVSQSCQGRKINSVVCACARGCACVCVCACTCMHACVFVFEMRGEVRIWPASDAFGEKKYTLIQIKMPGMKFTANEKNK